MASIPGTVISRSTSGRPSTACPRSASISRSSSAWKSSWRNNAVAAASSSAGRSCIASQLRPWCPKRSAAGQRGIRLRCRIACTWFFNRVRRRTMCARQHLAAQRGGGRVWARTPPAGSPRPAAGPGSSRRPCRSSHSAIGGHSTAGRGNRRCRQRVRTRGLKPLIRSRARGSNPPRARRPRLSDRRLHRLEHPEEWLTHSGCARPSDASPAPAWNAGHPNWSSFGGLSPERRSTRPGRGHPARRPVRPRGRLRPGALTPRSGRTTQMLSGPMGRAPVLLAPSWVSTRP